MHVDKISEAMDVHKKYLPSVLPMHVDKISEAMDVHKKNLPSDLPMHVDKISGRGSDTKEPCPLPTHTHLYASKPEGNWRQHIAYKLSIGFSFASFVPIIDTTGMELLRACDLQKQKGGVSPNGPRYTYIYIYI